MMRLPGVAASIMAGQQLVVPRWHTRVVNLVTQHRHTLSLGLYHLGTVWGQSASNGQLLTKKKTEAAVDLDGLANRVLYLGQRRVHL